MEIAGAATALQVLLKAPFHVGADAGVKAAIVGQNHVDPPRNTELGVCLRYRLSHAMCADQRGNTDRAVETAQGGVEP